MRLLRKVSLSLAIGIVLLVVPSIAANAESETVMWSDGGIGSGLWEKVPGTNLFEQTPSTGLADPYIYEARFACTNGDIVIFPQCVAVLPECADGTGSPTGEAGTAIYWYRALSTQPLVWTYFSGPECVYGEEPRDILAEIAGMIAHEFQQTPIAPAEIGSQPGPHTLRGKDTNVWAQAATQTFNLTLLDQQVTITARPVAYTWNYGDGTTWGPTPIHGAPLHQDRIGDQTQTSHVYTTTGRLSINLTTHFDGSYSVNGGPQLPIPGQGNIGSPALPLTVWRAETHLYAENCNQNPGGTGC